MVQAFVGALNGVPNGVFITTSSFTSEAVEYANNYPNATLSLIDGRRLAGLMIKFNLGVATERVIEIKRVDSDYFEESRRFGSAGGFRESGASAPGTFHAEDLSDRTHRASCPRAAV